MTLITSENFRSWLVEHFDLSDPLTVRERAELLKELIDLTAELNAARSEIEASLAADMESDELILEGLPPLVRHQGGRRTNWDGKRLAHVVGMRVLVDEDGVAKQPRPVEVAARVTEEIIDCAGLHRPSHGWSATALKKRGIKPSDYCEYEPGRVSVRFAG